MEMCARAGEQDDIALGAIVGTGNLCRRGRDLAPEYIASVARHEIQLTAVADRTRWRTFSMSRTLVANMSIYEFPSFFLETHT